MPTERRKCGKSGQVRLSGVGVDAIEGALDGARVEPAPLPRTPKKTMTTMMKQMVALTRSAHWMPNTFATA